MRVSQSNRVIVGIDVGGSYVKGVVLDESDGSVIARVRRESIRDSGGEALLTTAVATAHDAIRAIPGGMEPSALGMAVPGVVDEQQGVVRRAENLGWRDVAVRAELANEFDLPIWFGHDVYAGAVAEFAQGAAQGVRNGVFVPIGTGIAAAIVIDGRHLRRNGLAGEIGHLDVGHSGRCVCGKVGCLEAIASAASIAERYSTLSGGHAGGAVDVARLARSGDAIASEVWQDAVRALGYALSWLVGVLAPEAIVVGGGLARAGEQLMAPLRTELASRLDSQSIPKLTAALLGDQAGALGSALLAKRLIQIDET